MKLVVDVNLPPKWVEFLATRGIEAVHRSQVGHLRATDSTIMKWAREGGQVVRVLLEQGDALKSGAIITIDEIAARVRILPIRRQPSSGGPG